MNSYLSQHFGNVISFDLYYINRFNFDLLCAFEEFDRLAALIETSQTRGHGADYQRLCRTAKTILQ